MTSAAIETITAEDTLDLRARVLRPNQPREAAIYPGDDAAETLHLGARMGGAIVTVASFYAEGQPSLPAASPARLRGMATEPTYQGRGLGAQVLAAARVELARRGHDLLWCNARVSAEGFYSRLGFGRCGEAFEISGIGPHYLMCVPLTGELSPP